MLVYLNRVPRNGPWGGANRLLCAIIDELTSRGHEASFDISVPADVLFCLDPRPNDRGIWYKDLIDLKQKTGVRIVQRIGDLGTHGKPYLTELVRETIKLSDFLIFPSRWAYKFIGFEGSNYAIIKNKPDKLFYERRSSDRKLGSPVKIVTHHWSNNEKKGFVMYKKFDELCQATNIRFSFIGRKPPEIEFTNHIPCLDKHELAKELSTHDVYLTASVDEAGANHVLEAMAIGLPVVFSKLGGSIVDYCKNYGIAYDGSVNDALRAVLNVIDNFDHWRSCVNKFDGSTTDIAIEIVDILEEQANAS